MCVCMLDCCIFGIFLKEFGESNSQIKPSCPHTPAWAFSRLPSLFTQHWVKQKTSDRAERVKEEGSQCFLTTHGVIVDISLSQSISGCWTVGYEFLSRFSEREFTSAILVATNYTSQKKLSGEIYGKRKKFTLQWYYIILYHERYRAIK